MLAISLSKTKTVKKCIPNLETTLLEMTGNVWNPLVLCVYKFLDTVSRQIN